MSDRRSRTWTWTGTWTGAHLLSLPAWVVVGALALPVAGGFLGTLLPALGYFPLPDAHSLSDGLSGGGADGFSGGFSLWAFRELFAYPGLIKSILLTLTIGWGATLLSFAIALLLAMSIGTRAVSMASANRRSENWLSLFLSVPHSAFAIGFLFLLMPSGWLLRLVSPWLSGLERPPSDWPLPDFYGITALIGLSLKEIPFLLLVWLVAQRQFAAREFAHTALCLGYSERQAWLKVIFPQLYRRSRLAIFAVLAYSLSVVDVALILSPSAVPVLSVHVLRWSQDADTTRYFLAAAGAMLQLGLIAVSFGLWVMGEKIIKILYGRSIYGGRRRLYGENFLPPAETIIRIGFIGACLFSIAALPIFSVAHRWRFPQAFPLEFSSRHWQRAWESLPPLLWHSLSLGIAVAVLSLVAVVLLLEARHTHSRGSRLFCEARKLLFLPLLLPQVSFLPGVQRLFLHAGVSGEGWLFATVLLCHLLFAVPYMLMVLSDSYANYDARISMVGKSLGRSPFYVFMRLKLGYLLSPLLLAFAVGFAVSIGQYLPTVFGSASRFGTLTTEAVTLASGGNRGSLSVYASLQALFPLLMFYLVLRRSG